MPKVGLFEWRRLPDGSLYRLASDGAILRVHKSWDVDGEVGWYYTINGGHTSCLIDDEASAVESVDELAKAGYGP